MCRFFGEDEVIKMNQELAERRDFTAEDLDNLPEDVRAEVIDGQIFYMASPATKHQRISGKLYMELSNHIRDGQGICGVYFAPLDVYLDNDNRTCVQPDLIVICENDGRLLEDGCHGAPDLVIEITSKSTSSRDYGLKLKKYRNSGVREYWIVDPVKRTVLVSFFENEIENNLYSFEENVTFCLFPDLTVRIADWV